MPFALSIRVYWEDTDAGGVVFYANYLKYFERARTEWLRSLGIGQEELRRTSGGIFVVGATNVRYLQPARLDDELLVTARIESAGRASISLAQQAFRAGDRALLCEGTIRIGWVEAATLKPARMPANLLEALKT